MKQQFGRGGFNLPKLRPAQQAQLQGGRVRQVTATQFFWLNMTVSFASVAGENKQASTLVEQFPLLLRGAWSNLTSPRVRFIDSATGIPLSTQQVQLRCYAGNTVLAHPMLYWRKPYLLQGNTSLRGDFINSGAEAAGRVVFFCERPDLNIVVPVPSSDYYILHLDLGLTGGATQTGQATTQQIEHDLLIYGALSTSTGCNIKFTDTRQNIGWSNAQIPIGAFAGIDSGSTNVQPIMYYSTPYYLPRNASIRADWTNAGSETGKFVQFICERILS